MSLTDYKYKKHIEQYAFGNFLVTLKLLGVYKEKFLIEDLGSDYWTATCNCWMARNPNL
jgi:hypothetical protein